MPRLFSGIELPADIREDLQRLQQPLPSTRWLQPENLHITLRFLGDVAPPVGREFAANLASITFDPFPIRLIGLETFGGDAPRVLFAAVEPSPALLDLARVHESAARRAGVKPESRKFTPHVTLARLQAPRIEPIARYLSRLGGFTSQPFLVSRFVLFSSKPNTGGGPYVVEQAFPSSMGSFDDMEWDDDDGPHDGAW
ncbi:MAG: RNA 2',3'-cyclic phosphodiesterase [Hyphomicrobiaceae bacterium]